MVSVADSRPHSRLHWSPVAQLLGRDSSASCAGQTCRATRREPALAPLPALQGCEPSQ